ncbi:hypothetical protein M0R45_021835 [Rubus argutus]|uniref:Protein kinase domain-containing protein n=1 Tax=Rubus argutus TaxID=59490 RepID=A0AAW1XCT2_RUBAR
MTPETLFMFFVFAYLAVLHSAEEERNPTRCPAYFFCNNNTGNILSFPECGLYSVDCSESSHAKIRLEEGGSWHEFTSVSDSNMISMIIDKELQQRLERDSYNDLSPPNPYPISDISTTYNLTLFKCNHTPDQTSYRDLKLYCSSASHSYYISPNIWESLPPQCSSVQLPMGLDLLNQPHYNLTANFTLQVIVSQECYECYYREGICKAYKGEAKCLIPQKGENLRLRLGLGIGIGGPILVVACLFILWCYRQKRASSSNLILSRNISNSDQNGRSVYFGVSVFSYNELEEATNNFDSEKEIGDGGFGIVFHGKLKDGREVAVKRLYEHNYTRAEQFMNEIEILSRLRHKNLVSLYGCTSRRSLDLLLVYEYVPNGTVADHLHGDRAATGSLTWPIRMSIAIETASALCYLHACDIVHRDVKTTNILLDNNFCVKVADFGISRFFPLGATHVSTAPQGTPGYVDPEYHQCYQLTTKSDVYSFGVVLIELISSMAAVDITRHRDEIKLSSIAINKIQNGLYNELVDAHLGFESDHEVKRSTIAVADLAFQCLQQDSDMRPTMCEVLEALKITESRNNVPENLKPAPSPDSDQIGLLKTLRPQYSPNSVTQKWPSSRSTTPNASA